VSDFLTDGHLVITGVAGGKYIVISGDVQDILIKKDEDSIVNDLSILGSDTNSSQYDTYSVRFRPDRSGGAYRVKSREVIRVERVVTIPAPDDRFSTIEMLRLRASVPEHARVIIERQPSNSNKVVVGDTRHLITFKWSEEV